MRNFLKGGWKCRLDVSGRVGFAAEKVPVIYRQWYDMTLTWYAT